MFNLKGKIERMEDELSKFSDLDTLSSQTEEIKARLVEERKSLLARKESGKLVGNSSNLSNNWKLPSAPQYKHKHKHTPASRRRC